MAKKPAAERAREALAEARADKKPRKTRRVGGHGPIHGPVLIAKAESTDPILAAPPPKMPTMELGSRRHVKSLMGILDVLTDTQLLTAMLYALRNKMRLPYDQMIAEFGNRGLFSAKRRLAKAVRQLSDDHVRELQVWTDHNTIEQALLKEANRRKLYDDQTEEDDHRPTPKAKVIDFGKVKQPKTKPEFSGIKSIEKRAATVQAIGDVLIEKGSAIVFADHDLLNAVADHCSTELIALELPKQGKAEQYLIVLKSRVIEFAPGLSGINFNNAINSLYMSGKISGSAVIGALNTGSLDHDGKVIRRRTD